MTFSSLSERSIADFWQNSKYASSIATATPDCSASLSTSAIGVYSPVGLFGLQRKMTLVFGLTEARIFSTSRLKSLLRGTFMTPAPMMLDEIRYMEYVGVGIMTSS